MKARVLTSSYFLRRALPALLVVLGALGVGDVFAQAPRQAMPILAAALAADDAAQTEKSAGDDAKRHAQFTRAVAATRTAMAVRDVAAAKRSLRSVTANAQTTEERAQAERLEMLVENLEQFWNGIRTAVAKFQPTEELVVGKERVAIIDASRNELALQMFGRPHRYRIEAIPIPIIDAIARQAFAPTPGSKVVVGSFLVVDREGSRKDARKLWEEAAKAGEKEGELLLPELDIPLPPATAAKKR